MSVIKPLNPKKQLETQTTISKPDSLLNQVDISKKSVNILRNSGIAAGVFVTAVLIVFIILSQDFKSAPVQVAGLESRDKAIQELRVEPILDSVVPAFTLSANRHEIQATSLRKLELSSAEDEVNNTTVVIDKVIVAPKILNVKVKNEVANSKSELRSLDNIKEKPQAHKAKLAAGESRFTIQILASNSQSKIEKFIALHKLSGKAYVHHINSKGLSWFVLTMGEYANRQYAKDALRKLPSDIQQFKPWVRNSNDLRDAG